MFKQRLSWPTFLIGWVFSVCATAYTAHFIFVTTLETWGVPWFVRIPLMVVYIFAISVIAVEYLGIGRAR